MYQQQRIIYNKIIMVIKMKTLAKTLLALTVAATSFSSLAADKEFDSTIRLLAPIHIEAGDGAQNGTNLSFEDTLAGTEQTVVTLPSDDRAAIFSATGTPGEELVVEVVESTIQMRLGGVGVAEDEIVDVHSFNIASDNPTFSGNQLKLDAQGESDFIRVGASADIDANDKPGDYIGQATMRITYL